MFEGHGIVSGAFASILVGRRHGGAEPISAALDDMKENKSRPERDRSLRVGRSFLRAATAPAGANHWRPIMKARIPDPL
jgi:hypothetical protein